MVLSLCCLTFFLLLFLLLQPLCGLFRNAGMWTCLKGKICQEAMVGNHSIKWCKPPLKNWLRFVNFRALQRLIIVEVSIKRKICWWGASFVKQFMKCYPMYLWKAWWLHLRTWICFSFILFFHIPLAAHFVVFSVSQSSELTEWGKKAFWSQRANNKSTFLLCYIHLNKNVSAPFFDFIHLSKWQEVRDN